MSYIRTWRPTIIFQTGKTIVTEQLNCSSFYIKRPHDALHHPCEKIVFNLLYELSFSIRLHNDVRKIAIARIIACRVLIRNKIVPVKTNFLKFDAAVLMRLGFRLNTKTS